MLAHRLDPANGMYPAALIDLVPEEQRPASLQSLQQAGLLGFDVLNQFSTDVNYRDRLASILFDQNRRYQTRLAGRKY